MIDGDDFHLEATGEGRFRRHVPPNWCFDGRAFGGYTAALALAAVLEVAGAGSVAASLSVSFLHGGEVGPVEVHVGTLRRGRSATAYHATVVQHGVTLVDASAWVADAWGNEPEVEPPPPEPVPAPEDSPSLQWLIDDWGALHYADRRGIDYPTSFPGFARGTPHIALWARIDDGHEPGGNEPLRSCQIGDVLHADAHLFDAPAQVTGFQEAWLLSLDLSITWFPGATRSPSTAWRRVEVDGSVGPGGVSSAGTIRHADGGLLATIASQGLRR
jgi:acyl-coenzyme A thioesterase PaaI-like protein